MAFERSGDVLINARFAGDLAPVASGVDAVQQGRHGYTNLERFVWPCMSGYDVGVGLGGGAYSFINGKPCIGNPVRSGAFSEDLSYMGFPAVPRVSVSGKTTLRWSWYFRRATNTRAIAMYIGNGPSGVGHLISDPLQITNTDAPSVGVYVARGSNTIMLRTQDGTANQGPTSTGQNLVNATWTKFDVVLLPTAVQLYVNDVLRATHSTRFWGVNQGDSSMSASVHASTDAVGDLPAGDIRVAQVIASYE